MFSTAQTELLSSLVPTLAADGYKYYVAYTNAQYSGYYNSNPDLYVVFSEEPIQAEGGYMFNVPAGSIQYAIRTGNYSSSSSANNSDRITAQDFSGSLHVDVYEHIYTNAEYSTGSLVMPDINYRGGGEQLEKTNALGLVCTALLLFVVFCSFFKR